MSLFLPTWLLTQFVVEKLVKRLSGGEKASKAVLQRLDRLTQDEARAAAAETLKIVHGLVQDMSEQTHSACLLLVIEYTPF